MSKFAVLLLAAGQSTRFGDSYYKKPFAPLADRAVWLHASERFTGRPDVAQTIVVVGPDDLEEFQRKYGANLAFSGVELAVGGAERSDSVRAGLAKVASDVGWVAVHDAARPCVSDAEIDRVFAAALEHGAAILAAPVRATLKRVSAGAIVETVPRDGLWEAQTPQCFRRDLLEKAHSQGGVATDDAGLVEELGQKVVIVEGSPANLKITTKSDLKLAEAILKTRVRPKPDGFANPFAGDDVWR
ncbi:MAG: 2-C-methyl-D-erythritol 4-phosphate cytidylyltransferase [Lacipirellulaceae bacterium]